MENKIEMTKPESLFDFLATQCQKLDNRQITIEQAKAQASLAKQMNNVLSYKLDVAKFEYTSKTKFEGPQNNKKDEV